jgi:hypothetical protein
LVASGRIDGVLGPVRSPVVADSRHRCVPKSFHPHRCTGGKESQGYVAARIIECVFIAGGIILVLGVVSLRQDSPNAGDLAVSLAALKDWTFLFGPGLIVPFGNGLILGYLMYRSGLVPRRMA